MSSSGSNRRLRVICVGGVMFAFHETSKGQGCLLGKLPYGVIQPEEFWPLRIYKKSPNAKTAAVLGLKLKG